MSKEVKIFQLDTWDTKTFLGALVLAAALFWAYKKGYFSKQSRQEVKPSSLGFTANDRKLTDQQVHNAVNALVDAFNKQWLFFDGGTAQMVMRPLLDMDDADLLEAANYYARNNRNAEYKSLASFMQSEIIGWGESWYMREKLTKRLAGLGVA